MQCELCNPSLRVTQAKGAEIVTGRQAGQEKRGEREGQELG